MEAATPFIKLEPEKHLSVKADPPSTRTFFYAPNGRLAHEEIKIEETADGSLSVPSPISVFPKPIALSYWNFEKFYCNDKDGTGYQYQDGTRKEAGYCLVSAMLRHYFPAPAFRVRRLFTRIEFQQLIKEIGRNGTTYVIVETIKDQDNFTDEGLGEDAGTVTTKCAKSIVLLVVIATDSNYLGRKERVAPKPMEFHKSVKHGDGSTIIDEGHFHSGQVVILSCRKRPLVPRWEFYTLPPDCGYGGPLMPWFGSTEDHPEGFTSNNFGFESSEAYLVDQMFRAIVRCACGDSALNSGTQTSRISMASQYVSVQHDDKENKDQYSGKTTKDKTGQLRGRNGQFLLQGNVKEATQLSHQSENNDYT